MEIQWLTDLVATTGRNTARAWLDTVVGEAIRALEFEHARIRHSEPGWKFRPPRSQYYSPLARQLTSTGEANLQQMMDSSAVLKGHVGDHDRYVAELIAACGQVEDSLVKSAIFTEVVTRAEMATGDAAKWDSYFGSYRTAEDRLRLLAELTVNRTSFVENASPSPLPEHFALAPVWNHFRADFVSARHADPTLEAAYDRLIHAMAGLEGAIEALLSDLMHARRMLAGRHDLPYAESQTGVSQLASA